MDLHLASAPKGDGALVASYVCPCGCTPRLTYQRGAAPASDGCCCGNQFAVGPSASGNLERGDAHLEVQTIRAPWGEALEAAWTITQGESEHAHGHEHAADAATALDPVCGMTIDKAGAEAKDLRAEHAGIAYWFCGKGCKLEFGEDQDRFLDPAYVPSM